VVTEIGAQLRNYADAMNTRYTPRLFAGGGHRLIGKMAQSDGDVLDEKRADPDQALNVVNSETGELQQRVVVEVELMNRSPLLLVKWAHRLMITWKQLRVVIGLKIYTRSKEDTISGTFACVCFVLKKLVRVLKQGGPARGVFVFFFLLLLVLESPFHYHREYFCFFSSLFRFFRGSPPQLVFF
jgi:hypothetical protein